MASKEALAAAEHFGISQVIIETDSSQLREAITSSSRDLSIGGSIFVDIHNFSMIVSIVLA
jgi:ribonuclease HI